MSSITPVGGQMIQWQFQPLPSSVTNATINKLSVPQVDFCRPDYTKMIIKWQMMDDLIEGQEKIKQMGAVYLPVPYTSQDQRENITRYEAYKLRALFYNATRRTLFGLVGEVFSTDPVLDLPSEMEPLRLDVDGGGVTLDQQARIALTRVLALGRCGLYVDYPTPDETTSLADQINGNLRPVIYCCHPIDVINWRLELVGSRRLLTLVVIKENYVISDDGFAESVAVQYRALRLGKNAANQLYYYQQIYRKNEKGEFEQLGADIIPTDFGGKVFDEILFTFVGADNNDPMPTEPPLYDLGCVNIAHYRNSADYEEGCFMLGNPTPFFGGLTKEWVKDVMKGEVLLGARAAVMLPINGTAGLLQVQPNTMVFEAIKHKEDQMRGLGAKLIDIYMTTKTATEVISDNVQDSSILAVCAVNVSTAYSACLKWAGQFMGAKATKLEYQLNTDFSSAKMSPAERLQLMKEWQGSAISWTEYRDRLHRAGVAYLADDVALKEIQAEDAADAAEALAAQTAKLAAVTANAPLDGQMSGGGNSNVAPPSNKP